MFEIVCVRYVQHRFAKSKTYFVSCFLDAYCDAPSIRLRISRETKKKNDHRISTDIAHAVPSVPLERRHLRLLRATPGAVRETGPTVWDNVAIRPGEDEHVGLRVGRVPAVPGESIFGAVYVQEAGLLDS